MNGFNSKVVCKNSSITIWEILFNIAILIIHHKYRGGLVITRGGFVKWPQYAPGGANHNAFIVMVCPPGHTQGGGVNENVSPDLTSDDKY